MTDKSRNSIRWILEVVIAAGLTIAIPYLAWLGTIAITNQTDIREIQVRDQARDDRYFTAEDGLAVWREIGRIREDIAKMPDEDWMVRLESKIDRLIERQTR